MAAYALQTKTMLQSVSKKPPQILGVPSQRDPETKSQLPSKRNRESVCRLGGFDRPFTIRPCSASQYDVPETFKPVRIISRSQLALTFLDKSESGSSPPDRLFSADIEILETNNGHPREKELAKVLIARLETDRMMYAIERVQAGVFSVCKLVWWLREKEVEELWDPINLDLYGLEPRTRGIQHENKQWWQQAVSHAELEEPMVKCATVSMLRPKPQATNFSITLQEPAQLELPVQAGNLTAAVSDDCDMAAEAPSVQQLLENFVHQYLDAVYMSKMSLAYFAKGPVTRIRNAFTSSEEGAPRTYELVMFLRSMLLTHKSSEKKYQQKLPEVVRAIPPGTFSEDEAAISLPKPKKSKKKIKLNRDGMYPQEENLVRKWWISEMSGHEAHNEETLDQRIKRRVGDLRVRETLAQMILMLEIIALEALSSCKEPLETGSTVVETQEESQAGKPKKRTKKLEDIRLLLDLLLDKLCIWQSVDQDGILDFDAKTLANEDNMDRAGKQKGGDRLQGFCVEVIIPFYMSRLPEQAIMISKKLGGPVQTSPPKRKATRPPITSRKSGESKEPDLKRSRRSLARVATDTDTQTAHRGRTPSLNRSATDSALLRGVKRETSEVPLAAIPFQRSPSNAARQSLSHFKHLKGRQIDLSAPSAAAAAKLKQKKRVEEDLKEAITALKKPNRDLAVGGYVEEIERRGLGLSNSKSRKPATTVRTVLKDVLVSATPRAGRKTKDVVQSTPRHRHSRQSADQATVLPSSSTLCIPSSAVGPMVPGTVEREIPGQHAMPPPIAETPSRPPNRKIFESKGECRRSIFATPAKRRNDTPPSEDLRVSPNAIFATPTKTIPATPLQSAVFATPMKRAPAGSPTPINSTPPAPFAIPIKAIATAISEPPLPAFSNTPKQDTEPSIYDALGWNDNDDDLL
jgi:hypothetical protein